MRRSSPRSGALLALALASYGCDCDARRDEPRRAAVVDESRAARARTGPPRVALPESAPTAATGAAARARARLLSKLSALAAAPAFALGQQDATAYGVGWSAQPERSDVARVCGAHPAVHGGDLFGIERGASHNGDGVAFEHLKQLVEGAHRRGGIVTLSWHADNPRTLGDAWDTTPAVAAILPGAPLHARFRAFLERVAAFLNSLRDDHGAPIPVVFRPWHEHTSRWFWWGVPGTELADYVALYRFTVEFLRGELELAQLVFAFSPGGGEIDSTEDYLVGYPGDAYVDVLGVDHYGTDPTKIARLAEIVVRAARARGKIAALTELGASPLGIGVPGVDGARWVERSFFEPLVASPSALGIAYALAWRNAREDHFFLPYPGHPGAEGLARVCADERLLLENDLAAFEPR